MALLLFIVVTFVIGFILGGRNPGVRSVMGLGTAQRNVSAAIVVAAIVLLLVLMPVARRLGKSVPAAAEN